eukprot:6207277-Pleurochrysis_carterae.AAC.2
MRELSCLHDVDGPAPHCDAGAAACVRARDGAARAQLVGVRIVREHIAQLPLVGPAACPASNDPYLHTRGNEALVTPCHTAARQVVAQLQWRAERRATNERAME